MIFNSLDFLSFFIIVITAYWLTPHRFRWVLLLAASYYFYMSWKAEYVLLIVLSTFVDYFAAKEIAKSTSTRRRKLFLSISIITNLSILGCFKYFNFFNESLRDVLSIISIEFTPFELNVLLPIGISFYTFQTMSYTIDVYRGQVEPAENLGKFALFVSFFPQLVAGPIERASHLLPQFSKKMKASYEDISQGLGLMAWGFFKKVVIADRLALYVEPVFASPQYHQGAPLIIASYFFAFQIYCDFSGYSDIAIGASRVMGFDLRTNFKRPYFASNIQEFWKRWHISLSTWFRDYLYIPLGGNKVSIPRWHINILLVFVISGLWHGANWTFVVWGAIHGVLLILYYHLKKHILDRLLPAMGTWAKHLTAFAGIIFTFNITTVAWIFFRADTVTDAITILERIAMPSTVVLYHASPGQYQFILSALFILILLVFQVFQGQRSFSETISKWPLPIRWLFLYMLLAAILMFGNYNYVVEFIYFQF